MILHIYCYFSCRHLFRHAITLVAALSLRLFHLRHDISMIRHSLLRFAATLRRAAMLLLRHTMMATPRCQRCFRLFDIAATAPPLRLLPARLIRAEIYYAA